MATSYFSKQLFLKKSLFLQLTLVYFMIPHVSFLSFGAKWSIINYQEQQRENIINEINLHFLKGTYCYGYCTGDSTNITHDKPFSWCGLKQQYVKILVHDILFSVTVLWWVGSGKLSRYWPQVNFEPAPLASKSSVLITRLRNRSLLLLVCFWLI